VEYIAGDLPVLLIVPHGGTLRPAALPDRTTGETAADLNTQDLGRRIAAALFRQTGHYPHVAICLLHRIKLDCNRDLPEAATDAVARATWSRFHQFARAARDSIVRRFQTGLVIDLHGHAHPIQRLELGYLLSAGVLGLSDVALAQSPHPDNSSVRELAVRVSGGLPVLIRGPAALGSLLAVQGFPAVPSDRTPFPGSDPYFNGGYNTAAYGSRDGGSVSSVQIESHFSGLRDTDAHREAFAVALAQALAAYFEAHFGAGL
jgi:N-formylglutamate amidohydrolase